MKGYCIIYFEHKNDVTSIAKLCLENTSRRRHKNDVTSIVKLCLENDSVKLDYACDVISMFKINYMIAFHGISVL